MKGSPPGNLARVTSRPLLLLFLVLLLSVSPVRQYAAASSWINPGTGSWFDSENWDGGLPDQYSFALIDNGGTSQIDGGSTIASVRVGIDRSGTLVIRNGATLQSGSAYLGYEAGSVGHAVVNGQGTAWHVQSSLVVANAGMAELSIQDGALLTTPNTSVGRGQLSNGTITVTGAGSRWINSYDLYLGDWGTQGDPPGHGHLTIADGATVVTGSTVGGSTWMGNRANSGSALITGAGSTWTNHNRLSVGSANNGQMTIADGGSVINTTAHVGGSRDHQGTVAVTGEGSNWISEDGLIVGYSGLGEVSVTDGGYVSNQWARLGNEHTGIGRVTVSGNGSTWDTAGELLIGFFGTGELTIADGGVANARDGYLLPSSLLHVKEGGAFNASDTLYGFGTTHIEEGGSLAAISIVARGELVNHGLMQGETSVEDGGLLTGTGIFDGRVTISDDGSFSPGDSPGVVSTSETVWSSGGTYRWEINTPASAGGMEGTPLGWDLWQTGQLIIDGPFTIGLVSLTVDDQPGELQGWNANESQMWRVATSNNGAFSGIDDLAVDTSEFYNPHAEGSFWLSASSNGSELLLHYTPVPEPSSLCLMTLAGVGLWIGHRRSRRAIRRHSNGRRAS